MLRIPKAFPFLVLLTLLGGCRDSSSRPPQPAPRPGAPRAEIDRSTLDGKVLMGYQGWFGCPGDGAGTTPWTHWFRNGTPGLNTATFDMWPDTRELEPDERFDTGLTLGNGRAAVLFSANLPKTVARHFRWMAQHDLDGVFLQRFSWELSLAAYREFRDQVARNVMAGAEASGRVFAIMYDISGHPEDRLVEEIKADWRHLVDDLGLIDSPRYLHHAGRPVLGLWGLGFRDRPGTPQQARELLDFFQRSAPSRYRATLVGGVPWSWRTLSGDSKSDPVWGEIYRSFDVVSPWTVGSYVDPAGADRYLREQILPDRSALPATAGYMPVIFPGFSWHNLTGGPPNQIPRQGGRFYWRQAVNALRAECRVLFVAMFDEVDEGTAIFPVAPDASQSPSSGTFVTLDADGERLPSDWYLRLTREIGRMFRGEAPVSEAIPIRPDEGAS